MTTRYVVIAILLLALSHYGCKKENPIASAPRQVQMEYRIINHGDDSIMAAEIHCVTYFPSKDASVFQLKNWQKPGLLDTLRLPVADPGYTGCTMEISAFVAKTWPGSLVAWRYFVLPVDTMRDTSSGIVTFYWPEDTLRSKKYFW